MSSKKTREHDKRAAGCLPLALARDKSRYLTVSSFFPASISAGPIKRLIISETYYWS